jgi:hypothetical protein
LEVEEQREQHALMQEQEPIRLLDQLLQLEVVKVEDLVVVKMVELEDQVEVVVDKMLRVGKQDQEIPHQYHRRKVLLVEEETLIVVDIQEQQLELVDLLEQVQLELL